MGLVPDQSLRAVSLRESRKHFFLVMLYADHEIVRYSHIQHGRTASHDVRIKRAVASPCSIRFPSSRSSQPSFRTKQNHAMSARRHLECGGSAAAFAIGDLAPIELAGAWLPLARLVPAIPPQKREQAPALQELLHRFLVGAPTFSAAASAG